MLMFPHCEIFCLENDQLFSYSDRATQGPRIVQKTVRLTCCLYPNFGKSELVSHDVCTFGATVNPSDILVRQRIHPRCHLR